MAGFPPEKNAIHVFYTTLVSQANSAVFQANPTLAAGDAKVSTDGGAFANLGTLPAVTPASGKAVKVTLSAAEMNGDNVVVILSDAAGDEWTDQFHHFAPTVQQIDDLATQASVDTIDSNVDAILVDTGTTLQVEIDGVQADTEDIQARLPAALVGGRIDATVDGTGLESGASAVIADAVWDEAKAGHVTQGTYGENNAGVISADAVTGTLSTTEMTTNLAEATDDHYNGRTVIFIGGVLDGQATSISDYTGATKLITMVAITEAPANGQNFIIV